MFARCFLFNSLLKCLWCVQCFIFLLRVKEVYSHVYGKRQTANGKREIQVKKFLK